MRNNKGQALIEFVIVLPIVLLILLYIIDFTRVSYQKYELESDLNLIVTLYESKKNQEIDEIKNKKNITINYNTINNMTTIKITKKVRYNMPLLNNILGTNLETSRTIYNEE